MEEDWRNARRDFDTADVNEGGYGTQRRGGSRRDGGGDDAAINLRVTVVADNGNMCVFHKVMAKGGAEPTGIPANRIVTICMSQKDGSTLVITSEGTVCVQETFDEAMRIYAAARPIVFPPSAD